MTSEPAVSTSQARTEGPIDRAVGPPGWRGRLLYRFVRDTLVGFSKLYWRTTYEGLEHIPAGGPFVIACVHRSNIDFAIISGVARRRIRYMGKDSLWKSRLLGGFISALGAFPVNRGSADREAMRRCIAIIEAGEPLVLFPEGTRRTGPVVEEIFEGAVYIASRTQVPLVPAAIGGSERALQKGKLLPRPVKVHVLVGPPLPPPPLVEGRRPSRRALREANQTLRSELQKLFDRAQARAGVERPPDSGV